jgi:hypothetical protein
MNTVTKNNMSAFKAVAIDANESYKALGKLKKIGEYIGEMNASDMARFTFLLSKMSFDDIADILIDAHMEWASLWFVGCDVFSSAQWRAEAIEEYLLSRCCPGYENEMKEVIEDIRSFGDTLGEDIHTGASGGGFSEEEQEQMIFTLRWRIQNIPRMAYEKPRSLGRRFI